MTRLQELLSLADGLLEIPANEQHIGHLQVAMRKALMLVADELRDLREKADQP